jgi:hypothetical protein
MKISLENWLRNKLQENEEMHDFSVATDTVRCWIDEHKQLTQQDVNGTCSKKTHRRHITEKELKLVANELNLQYGLITHIINKVREMQAKNDNIT